MFNWFPFVHHTPPQKKIVDKHSNKQKTHESMHNTAASMNASQCWHCSVS